MNNTITSAVVFFLISIFFSNAFAHEAPKVNPNTLVPIPELGHLTQNASANMSVQAAKAFMATLSENEKDHLIFDLSDDERTETWGNLPTGIFNRVGLRLGDLNPLQQNLIFHFLASSLQENGYKRVADAMAAEAFLSTDKNAERLKWAPENFWITFYGEPSLTEKWAWHFGGHHLGLNLTVNHNKVISMSPSFVGTEPAEFSYQGIDYTTVRDMHEVMLDIFLALDTDQKQKALTTNIPRETLTGPRKDGVVPKQQGISGEELDAEQQSLLLGAIAKWVEIQPTENSIPRMEEIKKDINNIYFLWAGSYDLNEKSYARIQGSNLIIELLSLSGNVGENADGLGHYHTIYRNPTADYGEE